MIWWVSAALAVGMVIVSAATYLFVHAQITRFFDEELVMIAEAVHLGEDWDGESRIRIPRPGFSLSVRAYNALGLSQFETESPSMPADVPKLFATGHTAIGIGANQWRVYTHVTEEGVVQVAQPASTRMALARDLSFRMALPELILLPLFVLFVAGILKRCFVPVREISQRVKNRNANRLDPLTTKDVPAELLPLIEQINALLARLSASMSAQRSFVEDAAHELRTPVAALILQAQVAERSPDPSARAIAFAALRKCTQRTARVVEQLLKLAQIGPDVPAEEFCAIDLAQVARDVVGRMALPASILNIDLGAEASAPAWVFGSDAELGSLITNLVDNALRYAPPETEVTVRVASEETRVKLTVLDAGPGIPADERELVFNRFHRVAGDDTVGIGLGLAIVKTIVERHGGSIKMGDARPGESQPGLEVVILLPRHLAPM